MISRQALKDIFRRKGPFSARKILIQDALSEFWKNVSLGGFKKTVSDLLDLLK